MIKAAPIAKTFHGIKNTVRFTQKLMYLTKKVFML